MRLKFHPSLAMIVLIASGVEVLTKKRLFLKGEEADEGVVQGRQVGAMLGQVVKRHLAGCHLVLATTQRSPVFTYLLRYLGSVAEAALVVEIGSLLLEEPTGQEGEQQLLLKGLWGETSSTCHALLLDNTSGRSTSSFIRFLEWSELWLRPKTSVLVVGTTPGEEEEVLSHPSIRNTIHAFYVSLQAVGSVRLYRRCLYCRSGKADIKLLRSWYLGSSLPTNLLLFPEETESFMGHRFRVVTKNYFPYISYEVDSEAPPGSVVTLKDSLNFRMMNTMAKNLNFTFEAREPLDGQWGVPGEGANWTGIVGTLQHKQADFSMDLTLTPKRANVVHYSRVYIDESVVILSSKPRPLPEFLSLIRPFDEMLWLLLLVSIVVWGVTLWLLQRAWSRASGGRGLSLSSSLFYSWGIMLEDPPREPPQNVTAQMLVGWWLVFCLVVATAYRSSLISHLVVQGKSPLINSMEDLVAREGWSWGTPRMTGALLLVLSTSPYPAVQKVYKEMKADSVEEGLKQVLEGGYSFIYSKYYCRTLIATRYTDDVGYTPIHISATEYPLFAGNGFAFRRGAPFRSRLDLSIQRLLEAGLIAFWMDDVIATRVRNTRREIRKEDAAQAKDGVAKLTFEKADGQVVLGLHHLQVTFYLLLAGYDVAFVIFLFEYLVRSHFK